MELFYEQKVQGIIIRARARARVWTRWKEYEIFSQFEEKETRQKHLKKFWKLKISGSITPDSFKILCEEKHFYQELYTSKNLGNKQATETFLNSINIPSLTDEQKFSCEVSIMEEECVKALQSFQGNKVPGNRGLSIEFYSICWAIISDPFVNCVNECFTNGEMSLSQKQAVITLWKERKGPFSFRPILLANVDAKIVSKKVFATRIKDVLRSIIHHDQSGFVKDRFIAEIADCSIDLWFKVILSLKENIPGLIIFIDSHKVFDSIEWNFLFSCLEAFGFGP